MGDLTYQLLLRSIAGSAVGVMAVLIFRTMLNWSDSKLMKMERRVLQRARPCDGDPFLDDDDWTGANEAESQSLFWYLATAGLMCASLALVSTSFVVNVLAWAVWSFYSSGPVKSFLVLIPRIAIANNLSTIAAVQQWMQFNIGMSVAALLSFVGAPVYAQQVLPHVIDDWLPQWAHYSVHIVLTWMMAAGLFLAALVQTPTDMGCHQGFCSNLISRILGSTWLLPVNTEAGLHRNGSCVVFAVPAVRWLFLVCTMRPGQEYARIRVRGLIASVLALLSGCIIFLSKRSGKLFRTDVSPYQGDILALHRVDTFARISETAGIIACLADCSLVLTIGDRQRFPTKALLCLIILLVVDLVSVPEFFGKFGDW